MAPQTLRLPDGQHFQITPVFSGLFFKSVELNTSYHPFPAGWTVVLHTEAEEEVPKKLDVLDRDGEDDAGLSEQRHTRSSIHSYKKPTLHGDSIYISSISNPSSSDYKPPASPTRQIAMMLWVSLYWYFHQPEPSPYITTEFSKHTPNEAKPRGDWRIKVKKEGVLRGRNVIQKLERMGLVTSLDSSVGVDDTEGWNQMFVTRRMFWQIPGRLFLFTLAPNRIGSYPGSPVTSRPTSPVRNESPHRSIGTPSTPLLGGSGNSLEPGGTAFPATFVSSSSFPIGPYFSSSHLPTYYPPQPVHYIMTNGVRHPLRPKPPRMGEIFYSRFVPSEGRYLTLRVASLSNKPVPYTGPTGGNPIDNSHLLTLSDTSLLQMWLNKPRVSEFWGTYQPNFLTNALSSKHSFPVIGMYDGVPFGYFEVYWVKEDLLGSHLSSAEVGDWDRGMHVLVGEEWARGRVGVWLSSLVHWCWVSDYRTMGICLEPRVDNKKFIQHLEDGKFTKEKQISFHHKQAWFCKLKREVWEGPTL